MEKRGYIITTTLLITGIVIATLFNEGSTTSFLLNNLKETTYLTFLMAWETWWALVLGFGIAGAVEAWIPKERIIKYLRGSGIKELSTATFFGFISSSCSYSAIATSKNLFKKGASAAASLGAFMFASTNLVIEIGLVMWILLGWEFVLANFIGGITLIFLVSLTLEFLVPKKIIEKARDNALNKDSFKDPTCGMEVDPENCDHILEKNEEKLYFCSEGCKNEYESKENEKRGNIKNKMFSKKGWKSLAQAQWKEWRMLAEDIIIGFILAGFIGAFVPETFWISLFSGEATLGMPLFIFWTSITASLIGVITFVCSVGNIPFAAILWSNSLPFGSVLSFIYADLIVPPIVDAYRKYYGKTFAILLFLIIFSTAVITGVITHFLFYYAELIPEAANNIIIDRSIKFNYKTILNILFLGVFILFYYIKE